LDTRQCINCGTTSTTLWRREHTSGDYCVMIVAFIKENMGEKIGGI